MRFGFLTGGSTFGLFESDRKKYRNRHDLRYREILDEAVAAEKFGFDVVGMPEQHFITSVCATAPAPVLYGALAMLTKRIKLRAAIVVLPINHPVRVAENAAAIDILSGGRFELGTGRSNNIANLMAFGVKPEESRARYDESLEIICKAFTQEKFSHHGKFWSIPDEVELVPRPVQRPHPPIYVAASSVESHRSAGEKGIGVMTFPNYQGFPAVKECIDAYREAVGRAEPVGGFVTKSVSLLAMPSLCLESREEAQRVVYPYVRMFTKALRNDVYAYKDKIESLKDQINEVEYLAEQSAGCVIGDPDDCIRQIRRYQEIGIDEILLGIDGVPHSAIMRSLELFGNYVIPEFR